MGELIGVNQFFDLTSLGSFPKWDETTTLIYENIVKPFGLLNLSFFVLTLTGNSTIKDFHLLLFNGSRIYH